MQTVAGWFTVSSAYAIVKNCRCYPEVVLPDEEPQVGKRPRAAGYQEALQASFGVPYQGAIEATTHAPALAHELQEARVRVEGLQQQLYMAARAGEDYTALRQEMLAERARYDELRARFDRL